VQFPEEYSWPTYDHVVRHILATLNPQTILDVGAGAGKYGRMAREVTPQADVTAMEIGKDSIERHSLGQIYDRVLELGPSEIIRQQPEAQWDLAILGDGVGLSNQAAPKLLRELFARAHRAGRDIPPWADGNGLGAHTLFSTRGWSPHPVRSAKRRETRCYL